MQRNIVNVPVSADMAEVIRDNERDAEALKASIHTLAQVSQRLAAKAVATAGLSLQAALQWRVSEVDGQPVIEIELAPIEPQGPVPLTTPESE